MMTEEVLPSQQTVPTRTPEATARLAWRIIAGSTVCLLLLCTLIGYGLWRFRGSIMGPRTGNTLTAYASSVSRIRAGEVQTIAVPQQQVVPLREGETVRIGAGSQGVNAYITLWEGSTLQLYGGTQVAFSRLQSTLDSRGFKDILIDMLSGQMVVGVTQIGQYQRARFAVRISDQAVITLEPGGNCLVRAGRRNEVAVSRGQAYVKIGESPSIVVAGGQKAVIQSGGQVVVEPAHWQLLQNGDFAQGLTSWVPRSLKAETSDSPDATIAVSQEQIDGLTAWVVELERQGGLEDLGQAVLSQEIQEDVLPYRSILLEFDLLIRHASLPGGGPTGQNYPFNVRIRYHDAKDKSREYIYAFYDHTDASADTELPKGEGETTLIPHFRWEHISLELSHLYPAFLSGIDLISSGNDYRVWVTNVSLTASLVAE